MRIVAEVLFILEQPRSTSSIITYLTVFDLVMEGVSVWRWIPPVERPRGRQMKGGVPLELPLSLNSRLPIPCGLVQPCQPA